MTLPSPIVLAGNNLGERHRLLNSLVNEAFKTSVPFDSIENLSEASPVDRLFKISLASKCRNVDFIMKNLKDPDMLYVSRALKCKWLLEEQYGTIINPQHLEEELFPAMTATAANKLLHWIQHHLRDPVRCRDFYKHYKDIDFKVAIKFLWHCSSEFILEEFANIIDRIKPHDLKVISEKCPQVTKMFYEHLEHDMNVVSHYLKHEKEFFGNLKYILKSDPDTFFDVTEKYFNNYEMTRYHYNITKYVIDNHKVRFFTKPELYTAWILDTEAVADSLNNEELKDIIQRLAKAEYLESWFTYQAVEPLIKRIDKEERATFKKLIFVDKSFGDKITEWPYTPPASPVLKKLPGFSIFKDKEYAMYERADVYHVTDCEIQTRSLCNRFTKQVDLPKPRTLLDELYDKYRFSSFEDALVELRKRLRTESTPQNRQYIMLVLVSKSGGREPSLRILFELLVQYRNEPVNLRAAVVRSLVKRAFVWRLPADLWSSLLEWGHGLGLDGSAPEAACDEGLHAVVLRDLLAEKTVDPLVLKSFFHHFTNFSQYSLTSAERCCLKTRLPSLVVASIGSVSGDEKWRRLHQLLDTLAAYKIPYSRCSDVVTTVIATVQEEPNEWILRKLYNARICRKELFKENFHQLQNNESFLNALRHDISILDAEHFGEVLQKHKVSRLRYERFVRKLIIYFSESKGLADQYYGAMKRNAKSKPNKFLARYIAILAGGDLTELLKTFDSYRKERRRKTPEQSLAAALRANAHVARPPLDVNVFGWQTSGVKAVANSISRSPKGELEGIVTKLLTWKRTLRLALTLTKSEDTKRDIYKKLAASRPSTALKAFLRYLEKEEHGSVLKIWDIVKSLITELDRMDCDKLRNYLQNSKPVPESIKADFYIAVYKAVLKYDKERAQSILCYIGNFCSEVDETFFYEAIQVLFENEFTEDKVTSVYYFRHVLDMCPYIEMIVKFVLICRSEESQRKRLELVVEPLLARIEGFWKTVERKENVVMLFDTLLTSLKYNTAFFDLQYVSCQPVFERVLSWLNNVLPIDTWFDKYIHLHLTMLYYKTARHCVAKRPELFTGDPTDPKTGVEMFGAVFGKFVAHSYEELHSKYFQSIKQIYKTELMDYLYTYINYNNYDESKELFVIAFLKSILDETEASDAHFIAAYLFKVHASQHFKYDYDKTAIKRIIDETQNAEIRFDMECVL